MNCARYLDEYISAHADDELSPAQRRAADDHLGGCVACRSRLADERALKALVYRHAEIVKTPADVRLRIRAALGEIADPGFAARRHNTPYAIDRASRRTAAHPVTRLITRARRPRAWIPAAFAAVMIFFIAVVSGHRGYRADVRPPASSVAPFDTAISQFNHFETLFVPNVPADAFSDHNGVSYAWVVSRDPAERNADAFADVARSYREANMPDDLFDFESTGYQLYGGRIDYLAGGRPVTYTFYRGVNGAILDVSFENPGMSAPVGAIYWLGFHSFYEYRGYSICLTFYPTGHFVSMLVARTPAAQLIRDVALADAHSNTN